MSISTLIRRSGMAFAAAGTLALGLSIGSADSRPLALGAAPATAQTGKGILDRRPVEHRLRHIEDGMMQDPLLKTRRVDPSLLRFANAKSVESPDLNTPL